MNNKTIATFVGTLALGGLLTWGALNVFGQRPDRFDANSGSAYMRNGKGNFDGGQNRRREAGGQPGLNKENCLMDECLLVDDSNYPVGQLDAQTIGYLENALADERKAEAFYQAVIDTFGAVRPFINIIRAEQQHQTSLKAIFDKYGVTIPADSTVKQISPSALSEACQIGVDAEIANDALYQTMLPNIEQEDIKTIFTNLANASKEMHLPAFERCN